MRAAKRRSSGRNGDRATRGSPTKTSDDQEHHHEFDERRVAGETYVFRQGDLAAKAHIVRSGRIEPRAVNGETFPRAPASLPWLTTAQMIEVDRIMIDDLGIGLAQMMESAGRDLAQLTRVRFLGGDPRGRRVVVLAGPGGNGGGALVAARRLHGWGADVTVVTTSPRDRFVGVPAQQLDRVGRLGVPCHGADDIEMLGSFDVVLDGVIGYSLIGAPFLQGHPPLAEPFPQEWVSFLGDVRGMASLASCLTAGVSTATPDAPRPRDRP